MLDFYVKKTKIIIREIIKHVAKWLNIFPLKNRTSKILSPRKIIRGKDVKFDRDCQLDIGMYVQTHVCPDPSDRHEDYRSVGAIVLGPSKNEQGGYYFMSLETGKMIHRFKWTVLLFTQVVVDRVKELAENIEEEVTFADGNRNMIEMKKKVTTMNLTKRISANVNLKEKIQMNMKFNIQ